MTPRIVFFDTKPYDREFFDSANRAYGFDITYLQNHLTAETVSLAAGFVSYLVG